jgi:hypothetical protein
MAWRSYQTLKRLHARHQNPLPSVAQTRKYAPARNKRIRGAHKKGTEGASPIEATIKAPTTKSRRRLL